MKKIKAVIYARYSSHNQREESIEGQIRECQEFADKNEMTVIDEYIDRALSGKTDNRPSFQKLIKDSEKGHFDAVIMYTLDRFARNRYDSAIYKAKLKKNGVKIFYAKQPLPDTPEGIILESDDAVAALDNLNLIFDSGKNMARFVTDLLQYLRDLLIVKTGGENTHASELFLENLKTPQDALFAMIEMATKSLVDIKNSLQPKIYTEMMTIRLAEEKTGLDEIPDNLAEELTNLKQEIQQLKQQLANVGSQLAPAVKRAEVRPQKSKTYRVDRNKVNAILEEAVENPELARGNLTKLQNAWGEIIESLAGADKALLIGSQPVAANENHAILAFESHFNAEQTMKRENLNTMFGNLLSNAAGFSPDILAISLEDWTQIRAEFSARSRSNKAEAAEKQEENWIPEGFDFLAEKITVQDD